MARKWEQLYEYYKSDNANERMKYLKFRVDEEQAVPEEKEEYDKMQRVIAYLPEIENLREAIEALETNLEILKEEYANREENLIIEKTENKVASLEKEIEEKRAEAEELHKNAEDDEYWKKIFEVQDMEAALGMLKNELRETEKTKSKYPELNKLSNKDLRKEIFNTAGQISKCHVAAELYMRGESKETISFAIKRDNKFKRYTAKEPLPLTRKEMEQRKNERESSENIVENTNNASIETVAQETNNVEPIYSDPVIEPIRDEDNILDEGQTQSLINFEQIRSNHRILSALAKVPLIGRLAENRLNKIVEKEYRNIREQLREENQGINTGGGLQKPEQTQTEQELEATRVLSTRERRSKFIKDLSKYDVTDIAEKGINVLEKQRREEKLLEAKEKAVLRQNYGEQNGIPNSTRLGNNYSEKSGDQQQLDARYNDDDERQL